MFNVVAALSGNVEVVGKGIMLGAGMIGPGIGVGLIGNAFMNAVGRNPEAAKFLGQVLVFVAIVELMALLVFASLFIIK
ncbi:MAG TPA: ATP synthase F0 subunit C [Candidatus Saccharimonadales bacterium]|nr:ATP synthase F0 subunit C [Candidatus Saccharimonadales bacterium]